MVASYSQHVEPSRSEMRFPMIRCTVLGVLMIRTTVKLGSILGRLVGETTRYCSWRKSCTTLSP